MRHDAMIRLWRIKRFIVPMNVKGWEIFGCDNVATKGWFVWIVANHIRPVCYQIVAGVLCDVIVQCWFVFKSLPKVFSVYHKIMQENRGVCVVYQKLTCMLRRKRLLGVDNKKMASYAACVSSGSDMNRNVHGKRERNKWQGWHVEAALVASGIFSEGKQ
jgi:hypothetical protein